MYVPRGLKLKTLQCICVFLMIVTVANSRLPMQHSRLLLLIVADCALRKVHPEYSYKMNISFTFKSVNVTQ